MPGAEKPYNTTSLSNILLGIIEKVMRFLAIIFLLAIFLNPIQVLATSATIKMTSGSFDPKNIQIEKGDTVTFVNQDQVDRWPASNIHPTHQIYPEFDPKKPIHKGNSWEFQFDKAGIFRFHDHLNPDLTGVIIVTDNGEKSKTERFNLAQVKNYLSNSIKKIYYRFFPSKLEADLNAFNAVEVASNQSQLQNWVALIGGKKFMGKLVADSEGGNKVDCHQEAHLVGRTAYQLEGRSVFQNTDYNCHSGYLHGAMEAFIAETKGQNLIKEVSKLCSGFKTNFSNFECLHGIGHGLLAFDDYDIPSALDLCRKLSTDYERRSCYGGIFMENIMVDEGRGATTAHSTNWVSQDPHFPCSGVDKDYLIQYECYQMQTSRMLHIFKYDFKPIAEECLKAPQNMIEVCFKSMGRDIAGQTLRDPVKIVNLCRNVPSDYFRVCITGAENVIIDFWGENLTNQPQSLCRILSGDDKGFCYSLLGARLKDIFGKNNNKIKSICDEGDDKFKEVCINGESKT